MASATNLPKGFRDNFAQFCQDPSRPGLRKLLRENIGEFDHLDFKREWPSGSSLARHVLGFANSSGGALIVGVEESSDNGLNACGITSFTDKTAIFGSMKRFIPDDVGVQIFDFTFDESEYAAIKGKKFQAMIVDDRPNYLPFTSLADGEGIRKAAIYVRQGVETAEASHEALQRILNRRISTGHSTAREMSLRDHLDELRMLYGSIQSTRPDPAFHRTIRALTMWNQVPNPSYPPEDIDAFISRMIEHKKKLIERLITSSRIT